GDVAPGVEGFCCLEQITGALNFEALPTEVPVSLTFDASAMQINDTFTLADVPVPAHVTLLDDLDETVVATLSPPRVEAEADEIESETAVVGESAAPSGESAGDSD